jgi:hypothetical protein
MPDAALIASCAKTRTRCVNVRHQRSLDRTGGLNKGEFLAHRNVHRSEDETANRPLNEPAEKVVQDIRRATRKHYSAEETTVRAQALIVAVASQNRHLRLTLQFRLDLTTFTYRKSPTEFAIGRKNALES